MTVLYVAWGCLAACAVMAWLDVRYPRRMERVRLDFDEHLAAHRLTETRGRVEASPVNPPVDA